MRYHYIPTRMALIFKNITNNGKTVEKLEPSDTSGKNIKWCYHFGTQFGRYSKG